MQSHPLEFLSLFTVSNQSRITADELITLFKVKEWSPEGSNDRELEEAVIFNWENYIQEIAGIKLALCFLSLATLFYFFTGNQEVLGEEASVSLRQILSFVTGADEIPPLGFTNSPFILFSKDKSRLLPVSSTCALSITFSLGLTEYNVFKSNMDTGVLNAYEFGQVLTAYFHLLLSFVNIKLHIVMYMEFFVRMRVMVDI